MIPQNLEKISSLTGIKYKNNVNSTGTHQYMKKHTKVGTRRNALICRPHSLLELPDMRDSSKLCGLQIGIVHVEVKTQMTDLFVVSCTHVQQYRYQFGASDLSARPVVIFLFVPLLPLLLLRQQGCA